mgnify:CR=1 FL=1
MKYLYTQSDYIQAITRELNKRETTYPKMIAKMIKNGALKTDIDEQTVIMEGRCIALKQIKNMIQHRSMNGIHLIHICSTNNFLEFFRIPLSRNCL